MSKFAVRQAGPGDEHALTEMDALCFPDPWSLDSFAREMYDNPFAVYLLAESEGEEDGVKTGTGTALYGYAGVWIVADEGHITNVAVHPDRRGEGIAKVLMKLLIDYCDNIFVRDITLEVRPDNEAALGLYRAFGFVEEGRRKQYYEDKTDALILWRHGEKGQDDPAWAKE